MIIICLFSSFRLDPEWKCMQNALFIRWNAKDQPTLMFLGSKKLTLKSSGVPHELLRIH